MSPKGEISVDESSSGIIKVTLDPGTKSGEFYQVNESLGVLIDSGMAANILGKISSKASKVVQIVTRLRIVHLLSATCSFPSDLISERNSPNFMHVIPPLCARDDGFTLVHVLA
jgi:hypothetical protein